MNQSFNSLAFRPRTAQTSTTEAVLRLGRRLLRHAAQDLNDAKPGSDPLNVTFQPGSAVTLQHGPREENFLLGAHDGCPVLTGRGGSFTLQDVLTHTAGLHCALATVLPAEPDDHRNLDLNVRLAERGYEVSRVRVKRAPNGMRLTLLIGTHPDGTVLWFTREERDQASLDLPRSHNVLHGDFIIARYQIRADLNTLQNMARSDEDLRAHGLLDRTPEQVVPQTWGVSGEAVDAIALHLRTRPMTVLSRHDVPHCPWANAPEYATPELAYTRQNAKSRTAT